MKPTVFIKNRVKQVRGKGSWERKEGRKAGSRKQEASKGSSKV